MITNYNKRRPQSFVYQNKEVIEDVDLDNKNAFIFGPAIYLSDVENALNSLNTISKTYTNLGDTVSILFKGVPQNSTEVKQGGKIIAYKVGASETGKLCKNYYIIPNTDLWEKFTNNSDWTSASIAIEAVDDSGNSVATKSIDSLPEESGGIIAKAIATSDLPTTTGITFSYYVVTQKAYKAFNEESEIVQINSSSDIRDNFGPIVPSNPLSFGCSIALSSAGKAIFADTTANGADLSTQSANNYISVLEKIGRTDKIQFITPVFGNLATSTFSDNVRTAALEHVETFSNEEMKRWRRCYFGSKYTTSLSGYTTTDKVTDAVVEQALACNSDRFIIVWSDDAQYLSDDGLKTLSNDYLACAIAGLRSSKLPQQGLSRQIVRAVSAAPKMYTKWDDTDLDKMAQYGVFIITQNFKNSDVYIRHQLTTDTSDGLLYWEDSAGVNVDEISYMARELVEPYIGKRNATPQTLDELNNKWYAALLERTNNNNEDPNIGPQIIEIVDGSVKTYVDKNFKDRIIMTATLVIPVPMNTIVVYINAVASI